MFAFTFVQLLYLLDIFEQPDWFDELECQEAEFRDVYKKFKVGHICWIYGFLVLTLLVCCVLFLLKFMTRLSVVY